MTGWLGTTNRKLYTYKLAQMFRARHNCQLVVYTNDVIIASLTASTSLSVLHNKGAKNSTLSPPFGAWPMAFHTQCMGSPGGLVPGNNQNNNNVTSLPFAVPKSTAPTHSSVCSSDTATFNYSTAPPILACHTALAKSPGPKLSHIPISNIIRKFICLAQTLYTAQSVQFLEGHS